MPIIELNNVTKEYRLGYLIKVSDTIKHFLLRLRGKVQKKRQPFKALNDVSFRVDEGEIVGIIGANGAGKSTLLKILARVTTSTHGTVTVNGTVAPLIEVGAGFVSELSGRENIYLNGVILGMSRSQLRNRIDEIIEFSELYEHIDTPIKRYSSGMIVRLGFAIAIIVDADILIIDEVLSVGDLAFQRKCFNRIEDKIKRQGKTILLVSHSIRKVERLCTRAIWLDNGKIVMDGLPTKVCQSFYDYNNKKIAAQGNDPLRKLKKTEEIELKSLELINESGNPTNEITLGGVTTIRGIFVATKEVSEPVVMFGFHTTDFIYIASMGTAHIKDRPAFVVGENVVECGILNVPLMPGVYCLRVSVSDKSHNKIFQAENIGTFTVKINSQQLSKLPKLGMVVIPANWKLR